MRSRQFCNFGTALFGAASIRGHYYIIIFIHKVKIILILYYYQGQGPCRGPAHLLQSVDYQIMARLLSVIC